MYEIDQVRERISKLINSNEPMSESEVSDITHRIAEEFNTQCEYFWAGSSNSPNYHYNDYIIVWVDENGEIQGHTIQVESC